MVYIHLLKFEGLNRRLWIQGKSCLFSITNSFAFKKKIVNLCVQPCRLQSIQSKEACVLSNQNYNQWQVKKKTFKFY